MSVSDSSIRGIELNVGQRAAVDAILAGKDVFLTGDAGTGKSTVVETVTAKLAEIGEKSVLLTASTGRAAMNIGGITVHSAFQVPTGILPPTKSARPSELVREADVVIIDEISMVRLDVFSYIVRAIKKVNRYRRSDGGKRPPVQLVVIGDFKQLPPVLTSKEKKVYAGYYGDAVFAFEGYEVDGNRRCPWDSCRFEVHCLSEVMRQSEQEFLNALVHVGFGETEGLGFFRANAAKRAVKKAVCLCATNKKAAEINSRELERIPGKTVVCNAVVKGKFTAGDYPTDKSLKLKRGLQVMLLANNAEEGYANGSLGEVVRISKSGKSVDVQLAETGDIVTVVPYTWKNIDYRIESTVDDEGEEKKMLAKKTAGTFSQIPLKPAYAITIHKSQGQTYDAVNLYPFCFAEGQLYTALSRCKSIGKLHIVGRIEDRYLIANDAVVDFEKRFRKG